MVHEYDVFISYVTEDGQAESEWIKKEADRLGLKVFYAPEDLEVGEPFTRALSTALVNSRSLLVLWSPEAHRSSWVEDEMDLFVRSKSHKNQKCFVFAFEDTDPTPLKSFLGKYQRIPKMEDVPREIIRNRTEHLEAVVEETATQAGRKIEELQTELRATQEVIDEQLDQFLYQKFWRPFFDDDVYIFTCGRDVSHEDSNGRGQGGRTHIDFWDYQTVCDLHSFFAKHGPAGTHLRIQPPVNKVTGPMTNLSFRLGRDLSDRNCIIIGSPDVSDYAEFALSELHRDIHPWVKGGDKSKGFVLIKRREGGAESSIYREPEDGEPEEGVGRVGEEIRPVTVDGSACTTYGILTLAKNPCSPDNRIMILSGFTGIATNALARFLTDTEYRHRLHDLDRALKPDGNVEILVEVRYENREAWRKRDDRAIVEGSIKVVDISDIEY